MIRVSESDRGDREIVAAEPSAASGNVVPIVPRRGSCAVDQSSVSAVSVSTGRARERRELGVERAPIEIVEEGIRHSVRIGDAIDFEVEDIIPFGVETGQPVRFDGMFHPVASNLTMAEAKRSKIDAFGIQYEGKSGLSTSEFSWAA